MNDIIKIAESNKNNRIRESEDNKETQEKIIKNNILKFWELFEETKSSNGKLSSKWLLADDITPDNIMLYANNPIPLVELRKLGRDSNDMECILTIFSDEKLEGLDVSPFPHSIDHPLWVEVTEKLYKKYNIEFVVSDHDVGGDRANNQYKRYVFQFLKFRNNSKRNLEILDSNIATNKGGKKNYYLIFVFIIIILYFLFG